ncbi:MAG: acyl-CoA dehydrogenase [Bacteroidetes bacterium CG18_big_fil_WC_8_21_14_2_50_41_14]|nr:MAG: acyl-CoA dehydrogenase [Bacteroidetes bacterium CG18_big_fil_WC_8_21_14_2_50_41_14]PJB56180.1 MAG: acyl-CoA dehydrogenase [Bacteroidetes bacterium CG_4_9_14_3_um_filter_41_19]
MVDFSLEPKQIELQEKVRDFANRHMRPNARKYDELATFPWDVVKQAYKEGLMNGPMAKIYGGSEHTIFESALASEELGAGCVGIGICMDANTLALTPLYLGATEEQKKRFFGQISEEQSVAAYALTEPNAGSDVAGIKTQAILHGDKYIMNGHKRYITNGSVSSFITVFALTDPSKGARSLTAFVVPTNSPGVEIVSDLKKMGQRASVQTEFKFHDVEIPIDHRIGGDGQGFLLAMKTFERTRTGVAALSIGNAREAYETSKSWAKNRIQFGKPITVNQGVSFMIADMATEIEAARLLTWNAAWAYDTGQKTANTLSAMAKLLASDMAMKVTTDAVQIMAGEGYSTEFLVEKMMRDAKLCQIYEGTNQIQRLVIGKGVIK